MSFEICRCGCGLWELAADVADPLGERPLDIMWMSSSSAELELSGGISWPICSKTGDDLVAFVVGQDATLESILAWAIEPRMSWA